MEKISLFAPILFPKIISALIDKLYFRSIIGINLYSEKGEENAKRV